jgi:hypothetical protein
MDEVSSHVEFLVNSSLSGPATPKREAYAVGVSGCPRESALSSCFGASSCWIFSSCP